jgi:hypothetical protein
MRTPLKRGSQQRYAHAVTPNFTVGQPGT